MSRPSDTDRKAGGDAFALLLLGVASIAVIVLALINGFACAHRSTTLAPAPAGDPFVGFVHCPEPAQAIPASCGLRSLVSGERCVLCKAARGCLNRHQEWCVGEGGCADGACMGAE